MLSISIEQQRKHKPFFKFLKLCLADGYADATYLRLVLKSKGKAGHFFFNYAWRTDGRAGGGADPSAGPAVGVLLGPTGYTFIVLA